MDLIQTNKYQTKLTDELKASIPEDVWNDILDYIESVPFISWLISTENVRGYAKDRPKKKYVNDNNELVEYADGRIDVDIVHPHILENMDYFRGPAIHFQKFKKYTNITPNKNKKSEYGMFWANEQHKWKYGVVRESDGEWIPGYYYFYLNYSPIFRNKAISNASGKKKAERVYDFPDVFLGDYMFFHYLDQAHDNGEHAKVLKARGIGGAGPLSEKILTPDGFKTYGDINVGDYLIGIDGFKTLVTDKFPQGVVDIYEVEFMDGRKTRCTLNHNWTIYDKSSKYKNELKVYNLEKIINKGLYNINKNGNKLYKFFIPFISPVKYEEKSLPIGPYALGALLGDGSMSTKDLKIASCDSDSNEFLTYFKESLGDGYRIVKYKGDNINFRIYDHDLTDSILWHGGINPKGSSRLKKSLRELKLDVNTNGKFIPDIYKYSSIEQRLELIKGLMDTDGSISTDGSMEFSNSNYRLISDVAEVLRSLGIYCNLGLGRNPHQKEMFGKTCNIKQEYRLYISSNESLFKLKRKLNRVKKAKRRTSVAIVNIKKLDYQEDAVCFSVDNNERMYLTTDYIPTHNSYKMSAIGTCNMFIYKGLPNFYLASDKTFLEDDKGVFGKVIKTLDWVGTHCPLPKLRLVDQPLNIKLGYTDEFGHEKGILSSVFGISLMNQPNKARGIRGKLILYEEDGLFPNLETAWNVNRDAVEDGDLTFGLMMALGCVCEGTKVWTKDGKLTTIENIDKSTGIIGYSGEYGSVEDVTYIQDESYKECVEITTESDGYLKCSVDHPLLMSFKNDRIHRKHGKKLNAFFNRADSLRPGDKLFLANNINIFGNDELKDAYLIGMLIGDGNYTNGSIPSLSITTNEVYEWLDNNYDIGISKLRSTKNGIYSQIYIRNITEKLKEIGIYGQVRENKTLPINIEKYNKKSICELLGGYFEADGNIQLRGNKRTIKLTCKYKDILEDIKYLLLKIGIHSTILKEKKSSKELYSYVNNKTYKMNDYYAYVLYITNSDYIQIFKENIHFKSKYKQERLDSFDVNKNRLTTLKDDVIFKMSENGKGEYFLSNPNLKNLQAIIIKSVKNIGMQRIYNLTANTTHTYLTNGFISANTGGTTGTSFEASERFFYKPEAYNIYGIPNVFDKGSDGTTKVGFFWAAYLNRAECYDVGTGEPDVIKSLIKILLERYKIKYNSEISGTLAQRMAEQPIVPQEAVMRTSGNIFPVADIKYTIGNLMVSESYYSTHFVGNITLHPGGKIEFKEDYSLNPIRKFPTPSGYKVGAIEIFEKPINEQGNDKPKWGRYIAGIDPIDFDDNTYTDSLGCIIIFDTIKETIVAEYTGRPMLAEEFYETCRLMLIMYNAQANYGNKTRGMFPYFRNKGSLHLLCDVPNILFDKELTKTSKFGNNAKGTVENPGVIAFGNGLIREWLLSESFYQEYNDDNEQKSTYLNVHKIRSKALLEELAVYNATGNFDRVAALRLLMILKAEVAPITSSTTKQSVQTSSLDKTFNDYWNKIAGYNTKSYTEDFFKNVEFTKR